MFECVCCVCVCQLHRSSQCLREDIYMFSVTSSVCQGCVLALILFNFYFDTAIHMALDVHRQEERGIKVAYLLDADLMGNRWRLQLETLVTDLEYTDDMALLSDNWVDPTTILDNFATTCKKLGLTISCKKTKTLAVLTKSGTQSPAPIQLVPGSEPIEVVSHFQYLGSTVKNDCGSWICKASSALHSLSRILWCQQKIQTSTKVRILNSVILPIFWRALSS